MNHFVAQLSTINIAIKHERTKKFNKNLVEKFKKHEIRRIQQTTLEKLLSVKKDLLDCDGLSIKKRIDTTCDLYGTGVF